VGPTCTHCWYYGCDACRKPLPRADPTIQIQNDLDVCLRNRRIAELATMSRDAEELRDSATDMTRAIDELDMQLTTLRTLAFDVIINTHTHTPV